MRVEQCVLVGIGPFRDETFRFPETGTLLLGGSESGKTTFARVMAATLFGPESGRLTEGRARIRLTVHGRPVEVARDFRSGDVCISRGEVGAAPIRLIDGPEDLLAPTGGMEVLFHGQDAGDGAVSCRAALIEAVGIDRASVWRASGLVEDGVLGPRIDADVKAWLLENPSRAIAGLERELGRIRGAGEDSGQPGLAAIRNELTALRREQGRRREGTTRIQELHDRVAAFQEERNAAFEAIRRADEDLLNMVRFEQLVQERERLENVLVSLRDERDRIRGHLEGEEHARALMESEYADFLNAPEDVEEAIQIWIEASQRVSGIDREIERIEAALAEAPRSRFTQTAVLAALGLGGLAWLAALGAGSPALASLLVPLFSGAGLALAWGLGRNTDRVREAHADEVRRLAGERADAAAMQEGARKSLGKLAEYDNPAALRRHFRGYMDLQERLERSRRVAPTTRPLSEVMDAYEEVLSELQVLDTETRDLVVQARYLSGMDAAPGVLAERIAAVRAQREGTEARVAELEREIVACRTEASSLAAPGVSEDALDADIRRLEAMESEQGEREASVQASIDRLREAARSDAHVLAELAARASGHLERLTAGRYTAIRFGEDDAPRVRFEEAGASDAEAAWVPVERLSRAAADQLHFAVRLGLCEDVEPERALPLVLDEPFRGWDDARLERARGILETLVAQGRQCIVLSSDPRLRLWSWPVRELDHPHGSATMRRHAA